MTNPTSPTRVNRFVWLLVAIVLALLAIFWLGGTLLPFILGGALAYVALPFVKFLEGHLPFSRKHPDLIRSLAILIVFVFILGIIAGALVLIVPPLLAQFQSFIETLPQLIAQARAFFESMNQRYLDRVPPEIQQQIEEATRNLGSLLADALGGVVDATIMAITGALSIIVGLAVVPLFIYYVLKDRDELLQGITSLFPDSAHVHAYNVIIVVNHSFSSYVRGQLFLGLVVGILAGVGLTLLGVQFSLVLGLWAGLTELVPIIGPWLGAIPGLIVVLATEPDKFIWVALLYLGIQVLENSLLVPRIQSVALNVHPLLILVIIVIGSAIIGIWGIILGPPLVAVAKEVFSYFRAAWDPNRSVHDAGVTAADQLLSPDEYRRSREPAASVAGDGASDEDDGG